MLAGSHSSRLPAEPPDDPTMRQPAAVPQEPRHRFWTISNLLSITRALLAVPFALVMLSGSPNATWWGIVVLAVAALTDKLDGVLARKFNEITEWGKVLDPIADKIGIGVAALVLVKLELIPLWFVVAMIARDLLILAGGMYLKRRKSIVLQSNQLGKWTIGVLALTMFFAMLRWMAATELFLWLSVAMLAGSFVLYTTRFIAVLNPKRRD